MKNLFTFFILVMTLASIVQANTCRVLSTRTTPFKSDSHADYYRLGAGAEGIVYQVIPKDGSPTYIRKKYTLDPDKTIPNAIRGLSVLEKIFRDTQVKVRSVGVQRREGQELILNYTEGVTLEEVMKKSYLSVEQRQQLESLYTQALQNLETYVRQKSKIIDIKIERGRTPTDDRLFIEIEDAFAPDKKLFLYIKSDNLIVNLETLQVTLIDPS